MKGKKGSEVWDESEPSVELICEPVRFAPLGPMGREVSVNAQSADLQRVRGQAGVVFWLEFGGRASVV